MYKDAGSNKMSGRVSHVLRSNKETPERKTYCTHACGTYKKTSIPCE